MCSSGVKSWSSGMRAKKEIGEIVKRANSMKTLISTLPCHKLFFYSLSPSGGLLLDP